MVTIEFKTENVTVSEGDGSVSVNLVRTGNHSENITVYINVMEVENSAIAVCTYGTCMSEHLIHVRTLPNIRSYMHTYVSTLKKFYVRS